MKVTFTFDEVAMAALSIKGADVRHTIKKLFAERGLPCTSDGAELAFEDVGREDDYADMWHVILGLLKSAWFISSASSCLWEDEDGIEDVLAQAWKVSPDLFYSEANMERLSRSIAQMEAAEGNIETFKTLQEVEQTK